MFDIDRTQLFMRQSHIDAWVIYSFRNSNPLFGQIVGDDKPATRRKFFIVPRDCEPTLLVHVVDRELFDSMNFWTQLYTGWEDMVSRLRTLLKGCKRVAMEYSPGGAIPTMSWVDGGTIEMVRGFGVEVVTSADLFQYAVESWSEESLESHIKVAREISDIKDMAFEYIKAMVNSGTSLGEYEVQRFIVREFEKRGLETEDRPIVAVNAHSGNPHYEPNAQTSLQIEPSDWILIDLWARYPAEHSVFADITWVGYVGQTVPTRYHRVFETVKAARDSVVACLQDAFRRHEVLEGWQLDSGQ